MGRDGRDQRGDGRSALLWAAMSEIEQGTSLSLSEKSEPHRHEKELVARARRLLEKPSRDYSFWVRD
jgi:hypothetical protein